MTERRRISDENKAVVQRMFDEIINAHSVSRAEDFYDPNFVHHTLPPPFSRDLDGLKQYASEYFQACPDLHVTIDHMIAEGDWVTTHFTSHGTHQGELMGIPATGKEFTFSGVFTSRIVDGRFVEDWSYADDLGLLQQLGVAPSSAQA